MAHPLRSQLAHMQLGRMEQVCCGASLHARQLSSLAALFFFWEACVPVSPGSRVYGGDVAVRPWQETMAPMAPERWAERSPSALGVRAPTDRYHGGQVVGFPGVRRGVRCEPARPHPTSRSSTPPSTLTRCRGDEHSRAFL
eukprot:360745-Chlamydomonas_euryale.AAC.5